MLTALLTLAIQTLAAQPNRFGLPACDASTQHLVTRSAFNLCLSDTHKIPLWSAYELTPSMLHAVSGHRYSFRHDAALAATNADYRNSGYHRSHLVPASDVASNSDAVRESYLLSNAVPQLPELNLSAWRKIENDIRRLAAHSDAVYVVTGALFDCAFPHIGVNRIAVPCATYKVVLALNGEETTAFAVVLANQPGATRRTLSVRELERRAGLDFFPALPTVLQDRIETSTHSLR